MAHKQLHVLNIREAAQGIIGNGSFTTDWAGFEFQANSTNSVINQLRFDTSKTIRQSAIILASFNAVIGLGLAVGIFGDCYWAAKRADPQMSFRRSMYKIIGPMNIYPFVLAFGILIQGTIIAIEQAKGLTGLLILGCMPISQVMLPTIFIVPYIQLVFGIETTVRAFRRRAFDSFGKWTVSVCVLFVVSSLAATYAFTRVEEPPNFCFASLFWFVQKYRVVCFSLFTAISGSLVLGSVITFARLFQSASGGAIERIAASRMVYYMCIGAITNGVVIPFFASLTFRDDMEVTILRGQLSMAAMVATNLTALTNGGLYLFLRTCRSSNIGRKGYFEVDREKQMRRKRTTKRQITSPVTETYANQIEQPLAPPPHVFQTQSTQSGIPESQIGLARTMSANGSQTLSGPATKAHMRKASYKVFPQQPQKPQQLQQTQQPQTPELNPEPLAVLPAATYTPPTIARSIREVTDEDLAEIENELIRHDISSLLPPPKPAFMPGHQRDSSMASSATVQIGLRLSNVDDMKERMPTPRPTSSIYPKSMMIGPGGKVAIPLLPPELVAASSPRSSVRIGSKVWVDPAKQLPPSPLRMSSKQKKEPSKREQRDSQMLLSPAVYSPDGTVNNNGTGTMTSPSDRDPRMSPWDGSAMAVEKRPTEWI